MPRRPAGTRALAFALARALVPAAALAAKPPKKGEAPPAAAASDKPYAEWKKVTKDAEVKKGLFTL